jgi:hypothetical protein
LSAERANATRRLLTEAGLKESRIRSVTGNADKDPLLPADPLAAANRRIAIVVLRDAAPPKPSFLLQKSTTLCNSTIILENCPSLLATQPPPAARTPCAASVSAGSAR